MEEVVASIGYHNEISFTYFGFGKAYMKILFTFNNFINFNVGNKIVKSCAFFMRSYFLEGKIYNPKMAKLKIGQITEIVGYMTVDHSSKEMQCLRIPATRMV